MQKLLAQSQLFVPPVEGFGLKPDAHTELVLRNYSITSFNGSSCADNGKSALNTPEALRDYIPEYLSGGRNGERAEERQGL
eukprot:1187304-Prorocentrum_minimum.AAC.3